MGLPVRCLARGRLARRRAWRVGLAALAVVAAAKAIFGADLARSAVRVSAARGPETPDAERGPPVPACTRLAWPAAPRRLGRAPGRDAAAQREQSRHGILDERQRLGLGDPGS